MFDLFHLFRFCTLRKGGGKKNPEQKKVNIKLFLTWCTGYVEFTGNQGQCQISNDLFQGQGQISNYLFHFHYVVTWNVKMYVSHPLKCRMCQKWLKWCSDPPPTTTPILQLDFLDLENFLVKVWGGGGGGGGVWHQTPTPTTPKLQLDFLNLEKFLVKVWGGGGGGVSGTRPPPHHHHP